jgi:hypothetical protein
MVRTTVRTAVTLGMSLGLLPSADGWAQVHGDESVPLELVQVLLATGVAGELPEVVVGEVPEVLRGLVALPGQARALGGAVYSSRATLVVVTPEDPNHVRRAWPDRLGAAGWEPFASVRQPEFEATPVGGLWFCKEDTGSLSIGPVRNPEGGSFVRLTYRDDPAVSSCAEPTPEAWRGLRSPIPSLAPPTGTVVRGGSSGGGGDEWTARARLQGELSPDQVLRHYSAQLQESDWIPLTQVSGEGVAVQTYRWLDDEGEEWYALLTVGARSPDTPRLITLTLTQADSSFY